MLILLSSIQAQSTKSFSIGLSAGYSWFGANIEDFRNEFAHYGDNVEFVNENPNKVHDYGFENSFKIALSGQYRLSETLNAELLGTYMPNFTGIYKVMDHNKDILMGKFNMDFLSFILETNLLLDRSSDYDFWIGVGCGIISRFKETKYSFRASAGIYEDVRTTNETQSGLMLESSAQMRKNILKNIDLFFKLEYEYILTEISKTSFLTISSGVSYSI